MPKHPGTLTKAQKEFCERLLVNGYNYTEAYSYTHPNANYSTCSKAAYKYGKKEEIQEYIAQLQEEALKRAAVSPARVAKRLAEIAFADKEDETYTITHQLKAMELLQKQLGLDKKVIDAKVDAAVMIVDDVPEED